MTIYVEEVSISQVALKGCWCPMSAIPKLSRIIIAGKAGSSTDEANRRITLRLPERRGQRSEIMSIDPPQTGTSTTSVRPAAPPAASRYRYNRLQLTT